MRVVGWSNQTGKKILGFHDLSCPVCAFRWPLVINFVCVKVGNVKHIPPIPIPQNANAFSFSRYGYGVCKLNAVFFISALRLFFLYSRSK